MTASASPSIAAIATRRVLIAVAHPRIAAGLEALLDAEQRYEVQRASSGADLEGRAADAVIADAVFIKMNGAPAGIPAVVLLDASADRASLADRVPLARAWLTTASTGEELIAALDAAIPVAPPPPVSVAAPLVQALPVAPPRAVETPPQPAFAVAIDESVGTTLRAVSLVVFGVTCGAISLAFLWQALRP